MAVDPDTHPAVTPIHDPLSPIPRNIDAMAYILFAVLSRSTEDTSPDAPAERWELVKRTLPDVHAVWMEKAKEVLVAYRKVQR